MSDATVPPDEVLLELGRLVWAALSLEDVAYPFCRCVKPRHGPFDDVPIGTRIDEALKDLEERPDDELRRRAHAWLVETKAALEDRNHVVHGIPGVFVRISGDSPPPPGGIWLTRFSRKGRGDIVNTQAEVASLETIRRRLEAAYLGSEMRSDLWETRPDSAEQS